MEAARAIAEQGAIIVPIRTRSRVISLKLDEGLVPLLDRYANRLGMNRSELIRALIRSFIYLANMVDLNDPDVVVDMLAHKDGNTYRVTIDFRKTSI
jgi:hypothetical protein